MKIIWSGMDYVGQFSPEEKAALSAYYQNPTVLKLEARHPPENVEEDGYDILCHCGDFECGLDGPFKTDDEARDWPRENLQPKS